MLNKDHVFTLGIEEEFAIIDPATRELRSHIHEILEDGKVTLKEQIKPEMHQSVVELGTEICQSIVDAREHDGDSVVICKRCRAPEAPKGVGEDTLAPGGAKVLVAARQFRHRENRCFGETVACSDSRQEEVSGHNVRALACPCRNAKRAALSRRLRVRVPSRSAAVGSVAVLSARVPVALDPWLSVPAPRRAAQTRLRWDLVRRRHLLIRPRLERVRRPLVQARCRSGLRRTLTRWAELLLARALRHKVALRNS